jgi:hypothetical protein
VNDEVPNLRRHDLAKTLGIVAAAVTVTLGVGKVVMGLGARDAAVSKIESLATIQAQQTVDLERTKLQAQGANAAALRVEDKVDKVDTKIDHLNDVLLQIQITNRRR